MKLNADAFKQLQNITCKKSIWVCVDNSDKFLSNGVGIAVFGYRAEARQYWEKNKDKCAGFFNAAGFLFHQV